MGLTRKEALQYMKHQEAILLTAIPTKRVVQHQDFYQNVPNEDQAIYAMMSDVERRAYLEQLARGGGPGRLYSSASRSSEKGWYFQG